MRRVSYFAGLLLSVLLVPHLLAAPPAVDALGDPLPDGAVARLGTTRFVHIKAVRQCEFSADGKSVVCWTSDGSNARWEVATGRNLGSFLGPPFRTRDQLLSTDGSRLAHRDTDSSVVVGDTATGLEKCHIKAGDARINRYAWGLANRKLVTLQNQSQIRIWDADTGKELHAWVAKISRIDSMACSADGKTVAMLGDYGRLEVYAAETGEVLHSIDNALPARGRGRGPGGGFTPTEMLTIAPNGRWLVMVAGRSGLVVWDLKSGSKLDWELGLGTAGRARDVVFSPDGRLLAGIGTAGKVRVCDLEQKSAFDLETGTSSRPLRFSPDGKQLAILGHETALEFWDLAKRQPASSRNGHRAQITAIAFMPDGKQVVTAGQDGRLGLWTAASGNKPQWLRDSAAFPIPSMRVCIDDGSIVVDSQEGLLVLNPRLGAKAIQWSGPKFENVGLSANGRFVTFWNSDGKIEVQEIATAKNVGKFNTGEHGTVVPAPSLDGQWLLEATLDEETHLRLWHVPSGLLRRNLAEFSACRLDRTSYAPTTRAAAIVDDNGRLQILELVTGLVRSPLSVPGESITAAVWSADGRTLFLGCGSGGIVAYDLISGNMTDVRPAHLGIVHAMAVSADGKRLATGSSDTTVLLWDVPRLLAKAEALPKPGEPERLWNDLAYPGAPAAALAIHALAAAPDVAIPLLRERLKPTPLPARAKVAGWVRDLGDTRFAVRDRASSELARLGDDAIPFLQAARPNAATPEARRRIDLLLKDAQSRVAPGKLQAMRALEVLELIGDAQARQVLQKLAESKDDTWLKLDAAATLRRLKSATERSMTEK